MRLKPGPASRTRLSAFFLLSILPIYDHRLPEIHPRTEEAPRDGEAAEAGNPQTLQVFFYFFNIFLINL